MKKYIYQKFLLNCNYKQVEIENLPSYKGNLSNIQILSEPYNLFDLNKEYIRKVDISYLDDKIDTLKEWNDFVSIVSTLDALVLYSSDKPPKNVNTKKYREATLKSYVFRLNSCCINTNIFYNQL